MLNRILQSTVFFHLLCLSAFLREGPWPHRAGSREVSAAHTPGRLLRVRRVPGAHGSGWPALQDGGSPVPWSQALLPSACPVPYLGPQASQLRVVGGHVPDHVAGRTGGRGQLSLEEKKEHGDGELVVLEANVVGASSVSPPLFPHHTPMTVCTMSGRPGRWAQLFAALQKPAFSTFSL